MSDLTRLEKMKFERLFEMGSGYVSNFSNRTFQEFFYESIGIEIYEERFSKNGSSKANHLRAFWELESNALVAKAMRDMLDNWHESNVLRGHVPPDNETNLAEDCRKTVARLQSCSPVENLEAIKGDPSDRNFSALSASIRESISKNEPEVALDRLHTYTTKFLRALCDKHGLAPDRSKPLHSLMGEYLKHLKLKGAIESEMTERILKSSISILEAFNDVRNNQSLAHDNEMLNYEESILIFNQVAGAIKFIESVETKLDKPVVQAAGEDPWGEIPF